MSTLRIVVGIGANLGDRLATMRDAVARVDRIAGAAVTARSRVYETAPVGGPPQPAYLNAAILLESTLSPPALLDALLAIELELGRDRSADAIRFGPRTIDLDILWVEGVVLDEPRLSVPHPRLVGRAFALVPMLEVAPHAVDPRSGEPYVAPPDDDVRLTELTLRDP